MQRKKILEPVVEYILHNATPTSCVDYQDILENVPITKRALIKVIAKIKNRFASKIRIEKNPVDARKTFFYLVSPPKKQTKSRPKGDQKGTKRGLKKITAKSPPNRCQEPL